MNENKYEITVGYGDGVIKDYTAFLPEAIQNPKSIEIFVDNKSIFKQKFFPEYSIIQSTEVYKVSSLNLFDSTFNLKLETPLSTGETLFACIEIGRKSELLRDLKKVIMKYGDLGPLDLKGTVAVFNSNIMNDKYNPEYLWGDKNFDRKEVEELGERVD